MPISITEQDFFQIKDNLKSYLRDQTEFEDYDFEGSAMAALIDVLAYNTHYSAVTANMSVNEMFIDTAQLRSNVVSHAKGLGYVPQSMRSAVMEVSLTGGVYSNPDRKIDDPIIIPRGSIFKSNSGSNAEIKFITIEDYTAIPEVSTDPNFLQTGTVTFPSIKAYEGKMLKNTFIVDKRDQIFEIPNKACDTTSIIVSVAENSSSTTAEVYKLAVSITPDLGKVFFLQEGRDELFSIYFGDDILGTALNVDNIVTIEYLKTKGTEGNGITKFSLGSGIQGLKSPSVTTISNSAGGSGIETINSIKKNAPFDYTTQNRAVTVDDYKTIIRQIYPNIDAISVWGGEDSDPAIYGKVFISIKPSSGAILTPTVKEDIEKKLIKYKVSSIVPVVVDPEYIFIELNVNFKYNSQISNLSGQDIVNKVQTTIDNYNSESLLEFNKVYRNSNVGTLIDNTDTAIISSTVRHKIKKYIKPIIGTTSSYLIEFYNVLYNPHDSHSSILKSNEFYISGVPSIIYYIVDDGSGNVLLKQRETGTSNVITSDANFGTIDYIKGTITIPELNISKFVDDVDKLSITVELDSHDIVPVRNAILQIESVVITPQEDVIESKTYSGNTNFATTPARL